MNNRWSKHKYVKGTITSRTLHMVIIWTQCRIVQTTTTKKIQTTQLLGHRFAIGVESHRRSDLLHTQLADFARQIVPKASSRNFMSQRCRNDTLHDPIDRFNKSRSTPQNNGYCNTNQSMPKIPPFLIARQRSIDIPSSSDIPSSFDIQIGFILI